MAMTNEFVTHAAITYDSKSGGSVFDHGFVGSLLVQ